VRAEGTALVFRGYMRAGIQGNIVLKAPEKPEDYTEEQKQRVLEMTGEPFELIYGRYQAEQQAALKAKTASLGCWTRFKNWLWGRTRSSAK